MAGRHALPRGTLENHHDLVVRQVRRGQPHPQPAGRARPVTPPTVGAAAHDVRAVHDERSHPFSLGPHLPGSAGRRRADERIAATVASPVSGRFRTPGLRIGVTFPSMDMLTGDQVAEANLTDWRKLGQGLHARYLVGDFGTGARFVAAVGEAGDALGHHPRVTMGDGYVDLKLLSDDAVYRDDEGTEHVVEWVTQQDVDLARRVTEIAAEHALDADPASITTIELALDTAHAATIAPVWAALLTGSTEAQGRGTIGDDVRDATGRVPILWFQDTDEHETPRQRFHVDVWVPSEVAEQRIEAAVAAGGIVVDDSQAPSFTVIADQDGNKACVCTAS